jgi:hypothetical protein
MRLLAVLVAAALTSAATASPPASPDAPVSLKFVSGAPALEGAVFGIQSIDGQDLSIDRKRSLEFAPGQRSVRYTCPGATLDASGAELSFEFEAGQQYELVCSLGAPAVIRATGC